MKFNKNPIMLGCIVFGCISLLSLVVSPLFSSSQVSAFDPHCEVYDTFMSDFDMEKIPLIVSECRDLIAKNKELSDSHDNDIVTKKKIQETLKMENDRLEKILEYYEPKFNIGSVNMTGDIAPQ